MKSIRVTGPTHAFDHEIYLGGSKSISNRVLLIRALSGDDFEISNLSDSDDTQCLIKNLSIKNAQEYDCHHAGTTFRFLTALFAISGGEQILTGSSRMKQRPIGPLVDALRDIGCDIDYLENSGYPPLRLKPFINQKTNQIKIRADISSQFISALCMIAPTLPDGLTIEFDGDLVSRPYLEMTLSIMKSFQVDSYFEENKVIIHPQKYQPISYLVESDWSSASYHFALCSINRGSQIRLKYLFENSLQGDSKISELANALGLDIQYDKDSIILNSNSSTLPIRFSRDFIEQPDIAQTIAVIAASHGINAQFSGLKTLRIKETDRIAALQNELAKIDVAFVPSDHPEIEFETKGKAQIELPRFDTYQDHRMAMAFAPLAILNPVIINEPDVVSKSYPRYWEDLKHMGFKIEELS